MKKHIVVLTALLLGGCYFEVMRPSKHITGIEDAPSSENNETAIGEVGPLEIAVLDSPEPEEPLIDALDATDATADNVGQCAQNEYWEKTVNACVNFPCCDVSGNWTFVFNDMSTFPWKPITYSATIQQDKAALKFELTSAGTPKDLAIPKALSGTLEKSVLHMDGDGAGNFLTLDATDVKKQLANDEIHGSYTWIVAGGTTMNGTFYLQR
jgi:hypothetical protein